MEEENNRYSRVNRFEKKRKNTKLISTLYSVSGLLVVLLIGLFVFGGDDLEETANEADTGQMEETASAADEETAAVEEPEEKEEPELEVIESESTSDPAAEGVEIEELETYTDDNVSRAYTGNWRPVETKQEGPHQSSWEQGSLDWQEMMKAVSIATGLPQDTMIQWWVDGEAGSNSDRVATVSSQNESEIYRVFVSWVEEQGWKADKVEVLKTNDKKS